MSVLHLLSFDIPFLYWIHFVIIAETPLTLAAVSSRPGPLLLALVGGGALIDYRTRCGSTALHRAAEKNSIEAVRTLLDLGASPNVRDAKGLTPLWTAVSAKASPMLCQALLHDYSIHGVQDAQGWHEVHQVCICLHYSQRSPSTELCLNYTVVSLNCCFF